MGLKVKKRAGSSIPPMDGGTYPAVCVGIVDLGEQYSEAFKKYGDKVLIIWEIASQTIEVDGELKPRWLSKDFSASLHEKSSLHQFLVPWRGKAFTEAELSEEEGGFDLREMLGVGCFLQVIVEEKDDGAKYNKITTVIAFPSGMAAPSPQSPLIAFDMDAWDDAVFSDLPEWIQDKIKKSTQYQKLHTPTNTVDFKEQPATAAPAAAKECPI